MVECIFYRLIPLFVILIQLVLLYYCIYDAATSPSTESIVKYIYIFRGSPGILLELGLDTLAPGMG